jgi:hypothetical protein
LYIAGVKLATSMCVFLIAALCSALSASDAQSVFLKSSSVANGVILLEGQVSGKDAEFDCFAGTKLCSAPASGEYTMVKADANEAIYNDCTNVFLYRTTSSGVKEKVGLYCWLTSGDLYTDVQASATSPSVQGEIAPDHGEAKWAEASGMPVQTIHRLWRSMSHFADEKDDDSQILLLDAQSLAARNQLLMVTAAGLPTCLTVAVFSKGAGNLKLWSESSVPDGSGFCEVLGIEPQVTVSKGKILVRAAVALHSEHASHADVAEYTYVWTGSTYSFGHKKLSLQSVSASEHPR